MEIQSQTPAWLVCQIIQANLSLKSLLLKAGSKSHDTTAHSLMHGLLAPTCKVFGMQQPLRFKAQFRFSELRFKRETEIRREEPGVCC